jgi:hypothetical protein
MSQLEVDKIIPQSGTTLTIGDSGDTVNFADGTNLSIDTNTLYIDSTNNRVGIANSSPSVALDVTGDAKVSGDLTVDTNTLKVDSSNNRVGILTSSPAKTLQVLKSDDYALRVGASNYYWDLGSISGSSPKLNAVGTSTSAIFEINGSEKMRIDSSGNLLVGKTAPAFATVGGELRENGQITGTRDGNASLILNRLTSDGDIAKFYKDGTNVGNIGVESGSLSVRRPTGTNGLIQTFGQPTHGIIGAIGNTSVDFYITNNSSGSNNAGLRLSNNNKIGPMENASNSDNVTDIGGSTDRFKDLYLGGGLYVGGTGTANKLDDYEEGDWTPSLGGNATYYTQRGRYIKIGMLVVALYQIHINVRGTGSNQLVSGLPFTSESDLNLNVRSGYVSYFAGLAQGVASIASYVQNNSTAFYFVSTNSTSQTTSDNGSNIFGDNTQIFGTMIYNTAS